MAADPYIHPSSVVDSGATIGEGTKIWHFCHVMSGAVIGRECTLGQNVFVADGAVIGNRVKVQNNVSVYAGVTVEDDVFLGPSCVLTNVTNPRSPLPRHGQFDETRIRRGATVGANATVVCGNTVGRHAFVAAGAVVSRSVPDYGLVTGVPGRVTGWMSRHGKRLPPFDDRGVAVCRTSGWRYQRDQNEVVRCLDLDEDLPIPAREDDTP